MTRTLLVSLLFSAFSSLLTAQNVAALLKSGDTKMAARNYQGAIQDYSSAIQMNEAAAQGYLKKVAEFSKLTDYQKMIRDDAAEMSKGGRDYAVPYYSRGLAFMETTEYPEALKNFEMAISLDPKYPEAYYQRGLINQKADNKNEACIDFKLAMDLGHAKAKEVYTSNNCSSYSTNYFNDGVSKLAEKSYDAAINSFNLALKINSDTATYYRRGLAYYGAGKLDKALADFTSAMRVEIDSLQNADYPFMKGMVYFVKEQYKQAFEAFTAAVKIDANHYGAYLHRAYCNENMGQIPSAAYDFNNAIRIRPKDGLAYYKLGNIKQEEGDEKAACDNFSKAAKFGYEDAKGIAKECTEKLRKAQQQ